MATRRRRVALESRLPSHGGAGHLRAAVVLRAIPRRGGAAWTPRALPARPAVVVTTLVRPAAVLRPARGRPGRAWALPALPSAGNPPLLPTATLRAVLISPPDPPSPWSIDPERSQVLEPSSPDWIASPWSIDPERSQELPPDYGT